MPIIEVPRPGAQLSQGDILSGIQLYATDNCWEPGGGKPVKAPFNLCLVISRPCVAGHKASVLVAGVAKFQEDRPRDLLVAHQKPDEKPKDSEKYNHRRVLKFLTKMRDGHGSPDVMYLGQLPTLMGRYCARLDSLHTISIPPSGQVQQEFLKLSRLGTLSPDFARDLHVRVFEAVASMGFDDYGWFSDDDLNWLVNEINADLSQAAYFYCAT